MLPILTWFGNSSGSNLRAPDRDYDEGLQVVAAASHVGVPLNARKTTLQPTRIVPMRVEGEDSDKADH
jgi:hypothetical protein